MGTEGTEQVQGTQQMLKELPVTLACLSSGRMSEKKLTFLEASGGKRPGPMPPIPPQHETEPFPGEPQTAPTSTDRTYFFIRRTADNGESRWVRAIGPECTGASHPHLLLGPGEEDALDIIHTRLKVGRHGVGAQIPHLIATLHQGLPHLLLAHGHHRQPGLPSQVP